MSTILVTGGAGFIGVNASYRWARTGHRVVVLDDLSRRGADLNLRWLQSEVDVEFVRADVRDRAAIDAAISGHRPDVVLHLAAQVAVTTSVADPRHDFEVNALGTFNVLDALRRLHPEAFFIYASTNKVYGRMEDLGVEERDGRYVLKDLPQGVSESRPLDFHSPYGCSKGAADQYTLDFHKSYGLRTVVFRQSCIYGQRQFGVEDQGWVAWFLIAAELGLPVTIYGDGKQVRDLLHVDDLVDLYDAAIGRPQAVAGHAFNVGGGPENVLSLNELVAWIETRTRRTLNGHRAEWRTGDQPVFVANYLKVSKALGWQPGTAWATGISGLASWIGANRRALCEMHAPLLASPHDADR